MLRSDMGDINRLRSDVEDLYKRHEEQLLMHGWPHVSFVSKKALEFAKSIGADEELVEVAALTHDLNYVVETGSGAEVGRRLREELLTGAGFDSDRIESIVMEAHTAVRGVDISKEGMALSDADTLFKSLPITPVLFTGRYIAEAKADIKQLATKIVSEQTHLMEKDIYFYTEAAKEKYMKWAKTNLDLWTNVFESLDDEDVQEVIKSIS